MALAKPALGLSGKDYAEMLLDLGAARIDSVKDDGPKAISKPRRAFPEFAPAPSIMAAMRTKSTLRTCPRLN